MLKHTFLKSLAIAASFLLALTVSVNILAEEDLSAHWDGVWIAEGTLFSIAVAIENEELVVGEVESLGFEWSSKNGKVSGNIVTVEVEYAGVTGIIQAELVDPNRAVAFAATCLPDFMVVCMLANNRQAVFRKVLENAEN